MGVGGQKSQKLVNLVCKNKKCSNLLTFDFKNLINFNKEFQTLKNIYLVQRTRSLSDVSGKATQKSNGSYSTPRMPTLESPNSAKCIIFKIIFLLSANLNWKWDVAGSNHRALAQKSPNLPSNL